MPLPALVAPLIGLAGGLAGSGMASRTARRNTDQTIQAQKELAKYAYSKDLEMWNRSNEYNSPEMQMERLKAAGLNPNLVYGKGTVGNTSGQLPKYNTPQVQYNYKPAVDIPAALSQYQDFAVKQAQVDNLRAQEENINQRTLTESFNTTLKDLQGQSKQFDVHKAPYQVAQERQRAQKGEIQIDQELAKLKLLNQKQLLNQLQAHYKKKQMSSMDILNEKREAEKLFQQYKNEWMKQGITSSDNMMLRIIVRMLKEAGLDPAQGVKSLTN